jgi:hypothetical protein
MGTIDPRFDFGFDTLAKGTYVLEVKETGIEEQKEDKKSGKRYWVRLVAVGGDQDGVSHLESFFEKTKDDFSFSKMAGFLYKLGIIKTLGKIDTSVFLTPDFENRWKNQLSGKKMGGDIIHRYAEDDKNKENPYSSLRRYLTVDEALVIINKGSPKQVTAPPETSAPTAASAPAPWA